MIVRSRDIKKEVKEQVKADVFNVFSCSGVHLFFSRYTQYYDIALAHSSLMVQCYKELQYSTKTNSNTRQQLTVTHQHNFVPQFLLWQTQSCPLRSITDTESRGAMQTH